RLAALPGPRLGLVWASAGGGDDALRKSASLADFAPLAGLGSVVSLQKGPPAAEAGSPPPGLSLTDWTAELDDFAETAALIQGLDAVVSVDTAVLHLAAALGVRTFALIQHVPDWRWPAADRDRTPWYPEMRLFHQGRDLRWGDAIANLAGALPPLLAFTPR
ncbi:MAG: glycosyltransferase, partial [Alphaproteobacteria bacterium]|nr:glycosyltransferase [Alphaproteobacteria bacterium]